MKLIKQQNFIIATTSGLLVLLAFAFLFPIPSSVVSASECTSADSSSCTKDAVLPRAQTPSLSIALQGDSVNMNITPTPAGAFSAQTFAVRIATDNATGYSLYLSTKDGKSTLTNIHDPNIVINPVERSTPKSNFPSNSWGYKHLSENEEITDAAIFQPVPATQTFFRVVNVAKEETLKFAVAAKVDTSLPSGTYANAVVLSVIANPLPPSDISEISTMQEMTTEICENMPLDRQYRLADARDGKLYYVARFARDKKCWMTQNLAYDFVKGKVLTPNDSDVTANWTVPNDALSIGTSSKSYNTIDPIMWKGNRVSDNQFSYGNYYFWGAATADSARELTKTGERASSSICPKGWKLPSGGEGYYNTDLNRLITGLTIELVSGSPYYFVRSGTVTYTGELINSEAQAGEHIFSSYWSDTARRVNASTMTAYGLNITGTTVNPGGLVSDGEGANIRCIAK